MAQPTAEPATRSPSPLARAGQRVAGLPPASFFLTSAVFHYLGPSLAVLLFAHVAALGVAWLRIATAAVVFAAWRRPWRLVRRMAPAQRRVVLGLGVVLAGMNAVFYLALTQNCGSSPTCRWLSCVARRMIWPASTGSWTCGFRRRTGRPKRTNEHNRHWASELVTGTAGASTGAERRRPKGPACPLEVCARWAAQPVSRAAQHIAHVTAHRAPFTTACWPARPAREGKGTRWPGGSRLYGMRPPVSLTRRTSVKPAGQRKERRVARA